MDDLEKNRHIQLGLKIAYYRKLNGLTQQDLAQKVGISSKYVSKIETPSIIQPISLKILFDISNVFDISPYKLLNFEEDIK